MRGHNADVELVAGDESAEEDEEEEFNRKK